MLNRTQKLKIVFRSVIEHSKNTTIGDIEFTKIVESNGIDATEVLYSIIQTIKNSGIELDFRKSSGTKVTESSLLKQVLNKGQWSPIHSGGLAFSFGKNPSFQHSFLEIEEVTAGAAQPWDKWIEKFILEPTFVQAWVSDVDYEYWQNAQDPIEYAAKGRSHRHLPLKSNGLPVPLNQEIIDISNNPGRWILKNGYIEAIGSRMWLGKNFWKTVGEHKVKNLLESDFEVHRLENGAFEIISESFIDESNKFTQEKLRQILFDES